MKKFFLFFILFLALPLFSVSAQQRSERWVCLKAVPKDVHSASVSVDPEAKLLANSKTYIFECFSTSECTSGNAILDQTVFGKNSFGEIGTNYGYKFEGSTLPSNPLMSDGSGSIAPFTWQSSTPASHERRWLALNYLAPTAIQGTGEEKTQQIGTFNFEEAINQSNCVSIAWDPYGRVFDSQTLDPINKATVTLLKKRDDGAFTMMTPADLLGGNILNPQTTKEDGGFSFVVPDGTYKLSVTQDSYTFPEQLANIQSNYPRIYSDIYPGKTGEEIVQFRTIQHKDVPLAPKSISQTTEAKLMEYFEDLNKSTLTVYIKGRISHPFARIKAYSLKPDPISKEDVRYRLLTKTPVRADAKGNFTLKINQANFEPDENFGAITWEKVDLTKSANLVEKIKNWFYSLVGQVDAQVVLASSFRFEPIPNYLEGYTYDSQGKVIPNATVSIILDFSNKPAYQVKADENGYFKVASEFLPSMPYHVSYTASSGQVVPTSTSKFIVQNQGLIENSKININQFKNEQGNVITGAPKPITTADNFQGGTTENQGASYSQTNTPSVSTMLFLIFTIFALLIITVVVILSIYIKGKRETV
jgi:hypothetical protein